MEIFEEGQNQPKIGLKQMKLQEIMEKEEEDRISMFPDCLLLEILSRLPSTEDAVRTGTLSKRWKVLWTWVPTLIFKYSDYRQLQCRENPNSMPDYVSFVDKALAQCRQLKIKKFVLQICYFSVFESQVNTWIRYAMSRGVEELNFHILNLDSVCEFAFDKLFFIGSCFTNLSLRKCILNPSGAISWKNLRSLRLAFMYLDEDLIENILSGSPLLETLALEYCYGFHLLDITSKSVKEFVFYGYMDFNAYSYSGFKIIEINAPNILSLTIQHDLVLGKLLLVNVSSLVEANLDFIKMDWGTMRKEEEEEMLKGLIQNLRHVKELKIGDDCSEAVSHLKAKGFEFPPNIKYC